MSITPLFYRLVRLSVLVHGQILSQTTDIDVIYGVQITSKIQMTKPDAKRAVDRVSYKYTDRFSGPANQIPHPDARRQVCKSLISFHLINRTFYNTIFWMRIYSID